PGSGKAALCCASPTVPLAEPIPSTDPSAIRSPASEVVVATAYRHRVTLEVLRIFNAGMIPNIKENPRNRKTTKRGRKRLFNATIHALRMRIERTFAWEDKFKRLLLRFERIQQRHYGMKLMAYTLINLRGFCGA